MTITRLDLPPNSGKAADLCRQDPTYASEA